MIKINNALKIKAFMLYFIFKSKIYFFKTHFVLNPLRNIGRSDCE